MKLQITGSLRTVAESAWISTLDEIRAKARSDEDVVKVCKFLMDNSHTSPFECVTLTFSKEDADTFHLWHSEEGVMSPYKYSKYCRYLYQSDDIIESMTMDLLNFVKTTFDYYEDPYDSPAWVLFSNQAPDIERIVIDYDPFKSKILSSEDVSERLGKHNMNVELINIHKTKENYTSRATWRVKCPLSVAVQMLRHRTASFNMVSGRYRTINQEMVDMFQDCRNILQKLDFHADAFFETVEEPIREYKRLMKELRLGKDENLITNDEYKRMREVARYVLPEGRMTELYVTFYLDDFQGYCKLRDSAHAQIEHIWVAQQMKKTLEVPN